MAETTQEVATRPQLDAAQDTELARYARLGRWLAASETRDPSAEERGMAAALRLALAAELGLPMRAASQLAIVNGRLVVGIELLRAIAIRDFGYRVERVDSSDKACTAVIYDERHEPRRELGRTTFTIEDARRAKLVRSGGAYETHPERMLWARAAGFALKDYAPEVTMGLLTSEEAAELHAGYVEGEADEIFDPPAGAAGDGYPSPEEEAPTADELGELAHEAAE